MPHDMHESLIDGAKVSSQYPPAPGPGKRLFNEVELRLFRYTAVLFSLVALTALIGIIMWSFGWILNTFYNLLLSLSLAGILALVLHPVVEFLETRLHLPRLLAIILLLMVFFGGIAGLIFLLVPTVVSQIVQLMTVLPDTLASWQAHFSYYFPELSSMISERMESSGGGEESEPVVPGLKDPGKTFMSYMGLLAGLSFVPLFLFFTLLSGDAGAGSRIVIRFPQTYPAESPLFYGRVRGICHHVLSGSADHRRVHGNAVCHEFYPDRSEIRRACRSGTGVAEYRSLPGHPDWPAGGPAYGLPAAGWWR